MKIQQENHVFSINSMVIAKGDELYKYVSFIFLPTSLPLLHTTYIILHLIIGNIKLNML